MFIQLVPWAQLKMKPCFMHCSKKSIRVWKLLISMTCMKLRAEEDYWIGKFVVLYKSKKKIKRGNLKKNLNFMKNMKTLKTLKSNKLFSHLQLNKKPEKLGFKILWGLFPTIKILVDFSSLWLRNTKISNGNTMWKMKRNKATMMICKKTLLLRTFQKWINKSFWTTKIQKPRIKSSKKKKNLNKKKMKMKKFNKKGKIKCKSKMLSKFKKKDKLKKNH